jgi:hypothetical protein
MFFALILAAGAQPAAVRGAAKWPPAWQQAAANTRLKVADAAVGRRTSYGLIYVPAEQAMVCFGGCLLSNPRMDPAAAEAPYSEMTLNLEKGVWENRFPKGKEGLWGESTGPAKAPAFPGSYYAFSLKDVEGNTRPYLGAGYYNQMWNWGNYAFDSDRGRLVVYWTLPQQTAEYDPVARTWQLIASAEKVSREFNEAMYFGAMCYDPVNKEVLGGQGGWVYAGGKWRKLQLGSPPLERLRGKADALRVRARNLAGASRARYYVAESAQEAKVRLDQSAAALARDVAALGEEMKGAAAEAATQQKTQLQWAGAHLAAAAAIVKEAESALARPAPVAIHQADAAREELGRAVAALAEQPPPRAHARMVYDARNRKIVLFGGDALDRVLADTWVYDTATRSWAQRRPSLSPAPRSGYKMVYLPKSGKVLLMDGYGYQGNAEMWAYDTQQNRWQLLVEGGAFRAAAPAGDWYPTPAAVGDDDWVVAVCKEGRSAATFAIHVDPARIDAAGTVRRGVAPLAEKPYGMPTEDPQWFEDHGPPPKPAAEELWFQKLPPNTWVMRQSPNWPQIEYGKSRCWGTCAFDVDRDELLHFGGGHATYDGNAVLHYSIRANRYYIGHRPEHALNFAPNGIGIPLCKSYHGRPLISCHSYKCYSYDCTLGKLVLCAQKDAGRLFTYDPAAGDWDATLATPFGPNLFNTSCYQTKCAATPKGVVAWKDSGEGFWRVKAADMTWEKLPIRGKVEPPGWDTEGLDYDSRRDRLLLFSEKEGAVTSCDLNNGEIRRLQPAGSRRAAGAAMRETLYLPDCDAVLVGARPSGSGGPARWLLYDCAANAWLGVSLLGADPLGKERFNNSLGLMYDPKRKLVWAMDLLSRPHALALDRASSDAVPLE